MSNTKNKPYKVFITDANTNAALAITRSLGKRGIEVVCGESFKRARSFYSKYCSRKIIYPSPITTPKRFIDTLIKYFSEENYDILLPLTDPTILCILKRIEDISSHVKIPINDYSTQMKTLDKAQTLKIASKINVPIPKTYFIEDINEINEISAQLKYPVIIKPRQSAYWKLSKIETGATIYITSKSDLISKYNELHQKIPFPLIQELIQGQELGVYILIHEGELKAIFGLKRIRSFRPLGGASVLRESIQLDSKIKEYAVKLLKEIGWEGIAMVEFKIDSRDDVPKLMEINGRFWGSLHSAITCGVDFPSLFFDTVMGVDVEPVLKYKIGRKSRY